VVGVIIGLAVASGTLWVTKVKPPVDAANEYLDDVTHGNYDAAFAQLCPAERVDASPQSLERFARRLVFSFNGYEVSPFDVHIDGSRATVKVDLNPDSNSGRGDFVRLRLQKIDGTWRPCGGQFGFVSTQSSRGDGGFAAVVAGAGACDGDSQAKLLERG
jgi:hypothetical protein